MSEPIIELKKLGKTFGDGEHRIVALEDIDLSIARGEIFGIIGLSGAGKSTLVRCINLLETPTSGTVTVNGQELTRMTKKELLLARRKISMVFQNFNLLSQRTALQNVRFPLEIAGVPAAQARSRAMELLEIVGLGDRAKAYPAQMSGGQKQRVAIARALASNPDILLCDECTSALDPNTTRQVLELLQDINRRFGITIVVITHEMKVIEKICNRVAVIDNSHIVESGDVRSVFLHPKSKIARQLILPQDQVAGFDGSGSDAPEKKVLRVVFDGTSAFEPIISAMTIECNAMVNILSANTKCMDGRTYGQMVLQLPPDEAATRRITDYLSAHENIKFQEVSEW